MSLAAIKPSFNALIAGSMGPGPAGPLRIEFPSDWRSSGIMEWHHSRRAHPTKINMLQLRRERSEPFTHQYIVLILDEDCILRLDRRGDADVPMDAVTRTGTQAVDTISNVDSLADLGESSDCLAQLNSRDSNVDLSDIIKICFGIHNDDKARRYTLQRFNCYFFSWTIIVVTSRHAVSWDMLPFDSPLGKLSQTLAVTLSTKFTDALIDILSDAAAIIIMTLQRKLRPDLRRVLPPQARIICAMPQGVIRLAARPIARSWGRLRMHMLFQLKLHSALLSALHTILRSALADLRASTLRITLWQDAVGDAMREAARRNVMAGILIATANAVTSTGNPDAVFPPVVPATNRGLVQRWKAGLRAGFVAGFDGAIQVASAFAGHHADASVSDDTTWDEAWNSMRDASRDAAKEAVKDQEGALAVLWEAVWVEWDAAWEAGRSKSRETARRVANAMTGLVNDALADSVVNTLPDTHLHIAVRNMVPSLFRRVRKSKFRAGLADVTHAGLQQYILQLIRSHSHVMGRYRLGSRCEVENDMREAMDRIWRVVVDMDRGHGREWKRE